MLGRREPYRHLPFPILLRRRQSYRDTLGAIGFRAAGSA